MGWGRVRDNASDGGVGFCSRSLEISHLHALQLVNLGLDLLGLGAVLLQLPHERTLLNGRIGQMLGRGKEAANGSLRPLHNIDGSTRSESKSFHSATSPIYLTCFVTCAPYSSASAILNCNGWPSVSQYVILLKSRHCHSSCDYYPLKNSPSKPCHFLQKKIPLTVLEASALPIFHQPSTPATATTADVFD